jgi:transcriptional regulator with PAS, ATPase and Fis domain
VVFLNTWKKSEINHYIKWLKPRTSAKIVLHDITLSSPTNFGEIYQAASTIISEIIAEFGPEVRLVYHLSPGTPAMSAVWMLLAKTRFPAELIESSKDHGVRTASVPFDISAELIPDLLRKTDRSIERMAAGLPDEVPEFKDIIHKSEIMQRVLIKARRVAAHSIPVLIEGESGTGKELLARAIHAASARKDEPMLVINCGAIPAELVESELFGHEKGAFTGATSERKGHFEAADKGTLFLDEIGELPKGMQVKLLRVIQEGEVKRLGATKVRNVDVRIITATNRNLMDEVASGSFREDLFYRLAVAVIKLPPLRERSGDIGLLIDKILDRINVENDRLSGLPHKYISAAAKNILLRHPWPGNIRELQNTLTRAMVWSVDESLSDDDIIEALLPLSSSRGSMDTILDRPLENGVDLPAIMESVAVHYLKRGREKTGDNKTETAKLLGLTSYQTLTNWLKRYGLE